MLDITSIMKLGVDKIEATLLSKRFDNIEELKEFLSVHNNTFKRKSNLKDIDKAAELLAKHIKNNSHIVINSDYDADGVTASAIAEKALLEQFNHDNITILQNERKYGNGFNQYTLDKVLEIHKENPIGLIITVDHGSADNDRYKQLPKEIDTLITDHHELQSDGIPKDATVFINPQRPDDNFNKYISGATVIYLVMEYLYNNDYGIDKTDINIEYLLPLVATTIISDQMNLKDPLNRYLFIKGMNILNDEKNIDLLPWSVIKEMLEVPKSIDEDVISYTIAPLLNSGGRMDKAYLSQKLLASTDRYIVEKTLSLLLEVNNNRKKLQNRILIKAENVVKNNINTKYSIAMILKNSHGVGGIISSTIGERYNKPTFIFSKVNNELVGSGRSIHDNISIPDMLDYIRSKDNSIIIKGGGHKAAGGCSIPVNKFELFKKYFEEYVKNIGISVTTELEPDFKLKAKNIQLLMPKIKKYSPYGNNFDRFLLESEFQVISVIKVGVGKEHAIIKLLDPDTNIIYRTFYMGFNIKESIIGYRVLVKYTVGYKEYKGRTEIGLSIKDLKLK